MQVIRPLKTGGCSICRASDENVGKRRCNHVLDQQSITYIEKKDGLNCIDISGLVDGESNTFNVQVEDKKVKEYISNLSAGLSADKKERILNILRD